MSVVAQIDGPAAVAGIKDGTIGRDSSVEGFRTLVGGGATADRRDGRRITEIAGCKANESAKVFGGPVSATKEAYANVYG